MSIANHGPVVVSDQNGVPLVGVHPAAQSIPVVLASDQPSIVANSSAEATAAAPSYAEGTEQPLSQNLTGDLRVIAKQSTSPWIVAQNGPSNIATGQVSITSGGVLIANSRSGRLDITVVNDGAIDVYVGPSGVTTGTGLLLRGIAGAAVTITTAAAVYGIVSSTSQTISFMETY